MAVEQSEAYKYFMHPEPRENLGPVRLEYDKLFKRKVKVRRARIGLVRNASSENRKEVKVYLEPCPHIRLTKAKDLQGWYKGAREGAAVRPRPCYTEALLTEPYGGWCPINCAFCYINSGMRGYRGTGLTTVPLGYGEQIRLQLSKIRRGSAGYLTSFHDPFMSLERYYHNTQQAAEEFIKIGLPIFFLSRLKYPAWAIDQLKKNRHSYAQKSISTSDPHDWRKLSPGAMSLEEHYDDIRRLKQQGIYVSIQINPVIPGVTSNRQIVQLLKKLAAAGADHVIVKFVEAAYSWAPVMVNKMVSRFGDRGRRFADLFTQNIGGQRAIDEEYRINAHRLFASYARKFGLTYSVCYEYEYKRDKEGIIVDKTGISLGPRFTTSVQCHGQHVPVYTRNSTEQKFKPVKQCPASGCLYCAEQNDGEPQCGDALAGKASALRLANLREPIIQ